MSLHPLEQLSAQEIRVARDVVLSSQNGSLVDFRYICLVEPPKKELLKFLEVEHAGKVARNTPRPARLANVHYDVIGKDKIPVYNEAHVDIASKKIVKHEAVDTKHQACLTIHEFETLVDVCKQSPLWQKEISKFKLPDGFEIVIEPWPYGGPDLDDDNRRYFQGLVFAQDTRTGNPDSNFYAYPIPLIPVLDAHKQEIIRIDRPATGGKGDPLTSENFNENIIDHCQSAEYVPELLKDGARKDLKPLNISQPEGPSFSVTDGSLVQWQKWRFRVGFNPREGATIHDVHYDGRSVMYRLAISEMTVPYGDPRTPYHRKQAFDFGDGGVGNAANNLALGCDCLGVIKYFDTTNITRDGQPTPSPNVICLHGQDAGIGWKHTNWRTGRAVVTRNRELVVQFIITLANYEYVFAYKFDQSGNIVVETRATGVVSVVNIDPGKTSDYGNVVSSGALAQNHQHIFCVRMDPAIDGHANTVLSEESHPVPMNPTTNPHGNLYKVEQSFITRPQHLDAAPQHNRTIKIINPTKKNAVSGKPVGYKFQPGPTQLLLADKNSIQAKRALFAQHHVWVTKYRDEELYAAGRYTLQSRNETGGVADAVARGEDLAAEGDDVVVWNVFGLTHNPRVEDWPVMPVEIHQLMIRPADFFDANPSIDVPSTKNMASVLTEGSSSCCTENEEEKSVDENIRPKM